VGECAVKSSRLEEEEEEEEEAGFCEYDNQLSSFNKSEGLFFFF
jgi:hypothetical protein